MLYLGPGLSLADAPGAGCWGHSAGYGGGGVLRVVADEPRGPPVPSVAGLPGSEEGGVGGMYTRPIEKWGPPTMAVNLKLAGAAAEAPCGE